MSDQVETNRIIEKPHPWVSTLLTASYVGSLNDIFRRIPGARELGYWLTPKDLKEKRRMTFVYSRELVAKYVFLEFQQKAELMDCG